MDMTAGKDTTLAPGVVQRAYGESPAIIPGFKSVSMRDIIIQPGSKAGDNPMKNAMVCHITEGEYGSCKTARPSQPRRTTFGLAIRAQKSKRSMTGKWQEL